MGWVIGMAAVAAIALIAYSSRRPREFDYRDRRYSRHSDGSFTYADGGSITDRSERTEVEAHWNDSHAGDGSGDGGDGGGDGGGGD